MYENIKVQSGGGDPLASPDGLRKFDKMGMAIFDRRHRYHFYEDSLFGFRDWRENEQYTPIGFIDDNTFAFEKNSVDTKSFILWRRSRPEWWWGSMWMPSFWLMLLCFSAFVWSIKKDHSTMCGSSGAP